MSAEPQRPVTCEAHIDLSAWASEGSESLRYALAAVPTDSCDESMTPPVPMRLAVAGKGGAGKSTIAGTMARILARRGHSVLAINSDLMAGLPYSLGVARSKPLLADAVVQDKDGSWRLKKGIGPFRAVSRYATQAPDGVRLLDCGEPTGEDTNRFVGSLNGFAQILVRLDEPKAFRKWTLVGDLPAGPSPAASNWAPYANIFLVVVEPTCQSILSARRLAKIVRSLPGRTLLLVANKAREAPPRWADELLPGPKFASIPADTAVAEADQAGVAPIEHAPSSPAVDAIALMVAKLERFWLNHSRQQGR